MSFTEFLSYIREINLVSMFLRLLLASLGGGIIGTSRGKRQHAAGMRTHLLVCIGSASVMITAQYIVSTLGYAGDVMRMPAQVVSGIGFLGAGSIIVTGRRHISGLTTAAGLWASACMGLAAGAGYYECAIVMCFFIYIVLVTLNKLDATHVKASRVMTVYLELAEDTTLSAVLTGLKRGGMQINGMETFGSHGDGSHGYLMELEILDSKVEHAAALESAGGVPGVVFCEEMKA